MFEVTFYMLPVDLHARVTKGINAFKGSKYIGEQKERDLQNFFSISFFKKIELAAWKKREYYY